ncbi:MAG: septal ring lytic transglycosylase RlpA family protein, partial [Alphaproteobacteria bacterium]|nr:septal ring lytic transglycosylase RlpA family protein [Alphaproteobacteria bacterium]
KVTNLENGRSVIVRVNDRGPFVNNRIIYVSKSAAEALGFQTLGTAQVRVEYLKEESLALKKRILDNGGKIVGGSSETTPLPQNIQKVSEIKDTTQLEEGYFIQVGSFSDKENAWRVSNDLSSITPVRLGEIQVRDTIFYRVRLGPFSDPQEAVAILDRVREKYPSARVIQEVKK